MNYRLLSGFFVAMSLLALVGFLSWQNTTSLKVSEQMVSHTHDVLDDLAVLQRQLAEIESAQRGYLLTGEQPFLESRQKDADGIWLAYNSLKQKTADNPQQQKHLASLQLLISKRLEVLEHRIQLRRSGGIAAVATPEAVREGESTMAQIRELTGQMEREESELLAQRKRMEAEHFRKTMRVVVLGGIGGVLMLVLVYVTLIKENSNRRKSEQAREASEIRFRSLVENVKDYSIFLLDPEGKVLTWNAGAERLKGYRPEEIIGKHFSVFYPPEEIKAGRPQRELDQAIAEGRAEDESWRVRKDGSRFWANVVVTALRDEKGHLFGFSKITRDMSERREAEEKLQETAEELRRSNTELEQFAYVASHDLQEPLRAVSGCVQILRQRYKDKIDERGNELIQHAVDGAARMQTLIHDLLAYSRVTSKAQPLEKVESVNVLKSALVNLKTAIEENHARVVYNGLPAVAADPVQLSQLFQNLVGNALKYRGEKEPEIRVDAKPEADGLIRFAVKDNGIGIEPQYFERIFRLFQRLHTRKEYSGTGIGLALCKKIVERHGGRIWVESQPEQGSTFYFTLPAPETI